MNADSRDIQISIGDREELRGKAHFDGEPK